MRIRDVRIGGSQRPALISGLNVVESAQATLDCAAAVEAVAGRHGLPLVFKASFDKANRSSRHSYRGLGIDRGLRILAEVREQTGLPVLTDVHEAWQCKIVADVADCLQIPAFLARQTDLIAAAAATGRALNIKKAQFMAPRDVGHAVDKAHSFGCEEVLVTERGSSFGYNDLVVDFRGFAQMRSFAPLCFDATHAAQHPGAGEFASAGDVGNVAPMARAAVAVGVDAIFVEVHPDPESAPCDRHCQMRVEELDLLLTDLCAIAEAVRRPAVLRA